MIGKNLTGRGREGISEKNPSRKKKKISTFRPSLQAKEGEGGGGTDIPTDTIRKSSGLEKKNSKSKQDVVFSRAQRGKKRKGGTFR